jgi:TPR repeat protein
MSKQARLVLLVLILTQGCGNHQKTHPVTTTPVSQTNSYNELLINANEGDVLSQYTLGEMYLYGHGNKLDYKEKDYIEAVKWFEKAAEQGHVGAQNDLGVMYLEGKGVTHAL